MITVMIVDDSPLVRKIAADILEDDPEVTVVATASSAEIALRKLAKFHPDVITMDIEMPGMGGLQAIREIMSKRPTPVIVLSAFAKRGAELTLQALENGAVDFIAKPTISLSGGLNEIARDLVEKIKHASRIKVEKLEISREQEEKSNLLLLEAKKERRRPAIKPGGSRDIVAIGTSTGGPVALKTVLSKLPEDFPTGIVVVQHMPPVFTKAFADRLDSLCSISVREAKNGDEILPGRALIAPGDYHMTVTRFNTSPKVTLHRWEPVSGHRPSVDVLMHSVAREYGHHAIGVIMTGMGKDGAEGVKEMRKKGAHIIAQDKESSVIFGMNAEVVKNGDADEIISVYDIADSLIQQVELKQAV